MPLYDFRCTMCGNKKIDVLAKSDVKVLYLECCKDEGTQCTYERLMPGPATTFVFNDPRMKKRPRV